MEDHNDALIGIAFCIIAVFAIILYANDNFRIAIINLLSNAFFYFIKALLFVGLPAIVLTAVYKYSTWFLDFSTKHSRRVLNLSIITSRIDEEFKEFREEFKELDRHTCSSLHQLSVQLKGIEARLKKLEPISPEAQKKMEDIEKQFTGEKI